MDVACCLQWEDCHLQWSFVLAIVFGSSSAYNNCAELELLHLQFKDFSLSLSQRLVLGCYISGERA